MNYNQIKHEATILHVETFNSTKKRAAVVFEVRITFLKHPLPSVVSVAFPKLCWYMIAMQTLSFSPDTECTCILTYHWFIIYMCTLQTKDGDVHVHWKGAAEIILELCSKWMDSEKLVHMTREKVCIGFCISC